jgi:FlaA1/EpsC-like NDP-sugar epimerase
MASDGTNHIPSPAASRISRGMISIGLHALMFAVSWVLAFGVAYNFKPTLTYNWLTVFCLPLLAPVVIVKLTVFTVMRLHRGWWRYVSLRDVFRITQAAWISFFIIFSLYYVLANLPYFGFQINPFGGFDFPDSVFLIDWVGTIALVSGSRLAVRLYHEEVRPNQDGLAPRLLVLGAGNAGENVVREILRLPTLNYRVVGFLDDDPVKLHAQIHGIEVMGPVSDVKRVCDDEDIDEILIAIPSATHEKMRAIVDLCSGTNLRFKTLPAIGDLISGKAQIGQIRDVDINDLLGRDPVTLNVDNIAEFIRDRVVMVTGAGGSIGSEMCRQICSFAPHRLILAEQAEQNLFEIDKELRRIHEDIDIVPYIMDIGDQRRVDYIFRSERPTAVFHAAAHKHVR